MGRILNSDLGSWALPWALLLALCIGIWFGGCAELRGLAGPEAAVRGER